MSGITGKNTSTAFRKKDVAESRLLSIGFKKIRFMHKAAEGDTLIQLASLTTPTEATANGFAQPSVSDLTKTDLYLFKENVELESSIRGKLTQFLSYVINGPSTIKLLFEAEENEIITGVIDLSARTGHTLVDAEPLVSTGSLLAGETDFNVGTPFKVGMFPNAQHGAVMVFLDNQLVYRNSGNNPPGPGVDGEYYEVHAGGGLGIIIRFNTPDLVNDRNVTVVSVGSLVERPNGSQLALVEALQGQVTTLREFIQALVGEEVTVPVSAPTNVDLKAFGDDVFQAKQDIEQLQSDVALKYDTIKGVGKKVGFDCFTNLNFTAGANHIQATRVYNATQCTITRIGVWLSPVAIAAGIKLVTGIYSDSAGAPDVKLAQSNEYSTLSTDGGKLLFFDLQSPLVLAAGQTIHLVLHTNTNIAIERPHQFTTGTTYGAVYKDVTVYNATLPASFGAPTGAAGGFMTIGGY